MSCRDLFHKIKSCFCPAKVVKLSTLITSERLKCGFYMRPCNDTQSSQMFEAYFLATRADWELGGHIFVSSARAPDVLRILSRHGISPEIFNWSEISDLSPWFSLTEHGSSVNVYVEDDNSPFKDRAERFLAIQAIIRKKIVALSTPVGQIRLKIIPSEKPAPTQNIVPVMIVELNLQTKRGFSVVMAQLKSYVRFCVISRKNEQDYKVLELVGEPQFDADEHRSIEANTFKIYGSGNTHHEEMCRWLDRSLEYTVPTDDPNQFLILKRKPSIDADELYRKSNLGLAFDQEGKAILVNLSC